MTNSPKMLLTVAALLLMGVENGITQTSTAQDLARALRECNNALKKCNNERKQAIAKIDSLGQALQVIEELQDKRNVYTDSLVANLTQQLAIQDSVSMLLKANSDTLQVMVRDYSNKLDELDRLYIKELRKQGRPWFLTGKGLRGFATGVLIGGALGITFAVLD